MARVCWKGKRRSKAQKKRRKKSSKSLAQAGVALAKPLPRTPEQESCTVPVQVRAVTTAQMSGSRGLQLGARASALALCLNTCVFPTGG